MATSVRPGGPAPARAVLPRTFESFSEPAYRWYWLGMMAQMAAMNMEMLGRLWFIYRLTGSPIILGAATLSVSLPTLLLSLFGGVIADRVDKRLVMLVSLLGATAVALTVGLFITLGTITWVHLIIAGSLKGTIQALMMPARQAIISDIVGPRRLTNAVSLNMGGQNINRLLAPAAGGFIIASVGIQGVYYTSVVLYVVSALFFLLLPHTGAIAARGRGAWKDIGDAFGYLRSNSTILALLVMSIVIGILSWPFQTLLPIFTEDVLNVGPEGLGLLMSMTGVGALAGSMALASIGDKRRGLLFLHSTVILAVALAAFAFSRWYPVSLALMGVVGLGMAGRTAMSSALVQSYTEDAYRGRVLSIYMMEWGLSAFGTFGVSILAQFASIQWTIGGMALLVLPVAAFGYVFLPRLRRMD